MLDSFRRGQRWLTGLFIAVIGGVFVFFLGLGGPLTSGGPTGEVIVQLDDLKLDRTDFARVREVQENRLRDALGDQFDPRAARPYLDQQALRSVVDQAVWVHSAQELGLRVTKPEIQRFLRESPTFRDANGRFDQALVVQTIERAYGSQRSFLDTIEREFLAQKALALLWDQASVSDAELALAARSQSEEVTLAYVALSTESLPAGEEPGEDEIASFLEANEAQLREQYAAHESDYTTPERVRARHILIETPADADETALDNAQARAEAARERIVAGADFAEVARDVSEDAGTREQGGDLGFVTRSELSPALADVAFALQPAALSDVTKSERGFHVLRVEEKQPAGTKSFEDVRSELAREGATLNAARARAQSLADELAQAVTEGSTLEDTARARELTLVRTAPLHRRIDGYIPELGASQDIMATAFALDAGTSSPRVFEVGEKLVLIHVTAKTEGDPDVIAAQSESLRENILTQKRNELLSAWLDAEQTRLSQAGRLQVNGSLVTGS